MESLWNYLRTRTRDSMLAGMKDALDQAEQGENIQDTRETAARLVDQPAGNALPAPSGPAEAASEEEELSASDDIPPANPEPKSPAAADRIREVMRNETQPLDPFEERLMQTNPQLGEPYRGMPPRKRGRPRKNPEK